MIQKRNNLLLNKKINQSFEDLIIILKALGNEKRLKILNILLTGEQSFKKLLLGTQLQKTALSNHLSLLLKARLIDKPDYGKYQITQDGILFLDSISSAFDRSTILSKKELIKTDERALSSEFLQSFFHKS